MAQKVVFAWVRGGDILVDKRELGFGSSRVCCCRKLWDLTSSRDGQHFAFVRDIHHATLAGPNLAYQAKSRSITTSQRIAWGGSVLSPAMLGILVLCLAQHYASHMHVGILYFSKTTSCFAVAFHWCHTNAP